MAVDGGDGEYYEVEDVEDDKLAELLAVHEAELADPRCLTPRRLIESTIAEITDQIEFRKNEVKK